MKICLRTDRRRPRQTSRPRSRWKMCLSSHSSSIVRIISTFDASSAEHWQSRVLPLGYENAP